MSTDQIEKTHRDTTAKNGRPPEEKAPLVAETPKPPEVMHSGTAIRCTFSVNDHEGNSIDIGQPFECAIRKLTPQGFLEAHSMAIKHRDAIVASIVAQTLSKKEGE